MDAPVSRLSSPLLTSEVRTVELLGVVRLKKEKKVFLGGFWTCQTVLLGVVGMKEGEGWRETLLGGGLEVPDMGSVARSHGKEEARAGLLIMS